jgi:general secretion pathway protein E
MFKPLWTRYMNLVVKDLKDIVLDNQLITNDDIEEYQKSLADQESEKLSFFEFLLQKKQVDEEKLATIISKEMSVPFVTEMDEPAVDVNLLAKIPLKFLRENLLFPYLPDDKPAILVANPCDSVPLEEMRLVIGQYKVAVGTKAFVSEQINRYYPIEGSKKVMEELEADGEAVQKIDFNIINEEDIMGLAQEAPVIKLVNNILYQAAKRGASDIHIEPFEKELRVRYRIDGALYIVMSPPKRIQSALSSRLKIMSQLNIAEKRQPQDGRIQIGIKTGSANKPIDIRVSVLPVVHGESIVMRLLDKTKSFKPIEDLGMNERDVTTVKDAIEQPNGIVLVTGPTGSGKTSTLYSILNRLNETDTCIITVEDPVEYQMSGICQVQVREKIGLTFAAALRSILRQDPDIVMIGETRDKETAQIAIQAALTGHIVLSTLHTNSACASITRLIDMGVEPFLIASTLAVVIAQRLVRRLCEKCKVKHTPTAEEVRRLPNQGKALEGATIYMAKGCPQCMGSGYKGRLPIFEILKMSPDIVKLTLERADSTKVEEAAKKDGMTSLIDDGLEKVKKGMTTIEEILSVAMSY